MTAELPPSLGTDWAAEVRRFKARSAQRQAVHPSALPDYQGPPAGFGLRLAAYLIDGVIVNVTVSAVLVPLYLWWLSTTDIDQREDPALTGGELGRVLLVAFLVIFALTYVYHVELMFRRGATPGKRLLKIKVVPLDPDPPLTRGRAAIRWVVQWVGGLCVPCGLFYYLDGLWQLWDENDQCLHDKAARTTVVRAH